jgi:hypothetical protein
MKDDQTLNRVALKGNLERIKFELPKADLEENFIKGSGKGG